MYKSENIKKSNTVTIQDKFYICICPGGRQTLFSRWRATTTVRLFQNVIFLKSAMIFFNTTQSVVKKKNVPTP